ncbi:hypothetical protein DKX38_026828 [Salix brachista]|uniref:PPM-type phosphatase domain-containing protein n=1 Tax=Salix brachista TaxID=2182728 RepID=A0A5N5JEI3_9ROSI|nr:hypothetical protein DKX38_026828 [Salix brachista]
MVYHLCKVGVQPWKMRFDYKIIGNGRLRYGLSSMQGWRATMEDAAYSLSRDHKPDLEAEKERILKGGGFIHAGRVNGCLNLARALGDVEFKQNKFFPVEKQIVTANPDINTVELCVDDDFLVLTCDGISV